MFFPHHDMQKILLDREDCLVEGILALILFLFVMLEELVFHCYLMTHTLLWVLSLLLDLTTQKTFPGHCLHLK